MTEINFSAEEAGWLEDLRGRLVAHRWSSAWAMFCQLGVVNESDPRFEDPLDVIKRNQGAWNRAVGGIIDSVPRAREELRAKARREYARHALVGHDQHGLVLMDEWRVMPARSRCDLTCEHHARWLVNVFLR